MVTDHECQCATCDIHIPIANGMEMCDMCRSYRCTYARPYHNGEEYEEPRFTDVPEGEDDDENEEEAEEEEETDRVLTAERVRAEFQRLTRVAAMPPAFVQALDAATPLRTADWAYTTNTTLPPGDYTVRLDELTFPPEPAEAEEPIIHDPTGNPPLI